MITQEPYFDILIHKKEIMLIFEGRINKPQHAPYLLFDKKESAALFRDDEEVIHLTHMPKPVLKQLKKRKEISVIELTPGSEIQHSYMAPLSIDKKLGKVLKKI